MSSVTAFGLISTNQYHLNAFFIAVTTSELYIMDILVPIYGDLFPTLYK